MASSKTILVTGATGKVGRNFIERMAGSREHADLRIRALWHKQECKRGTD